MTTPAEPPYEPAHTPTPTSYQRGYWYNLHGYDWYFNEPLRRADENGYESRNDDLTDDLLPGHIRQAEELHELILEIDYGLLQELPHESGVATTFAYLLQQYLENKAHERAERRAEKIPVLRQNTDKTGAVTDEITVDTALLYETPVISVLVGKSFFEVAIRALRPTDLSLVWEDLARAFADPRLLYHRNGQGKYGQSVSLMREATLLLDALRNRSEHYAGALWHNDVTLRTGMNGASLAPFDMTHTSRRLIPALDALARELDPRQGQRRCSFRTTDSSLMGIAFQTPPKPRSVEHFFQETDESHLRYNHGGSLETDDTDVLLSVSFPLTLSHTMTASLLAQIIAQIVYETVGERAELRADRYVYGDEFVITFAMGGDWSTEDARAIIDTLMKIPSQSEDLLPEVRLLAFMEDFHLDGHFESVLYTRRVEVEGLTVERLRSQLHEAFRRFHLPEPLVRGELLDAYPPLLEPTGLRVTYGSGEGTAFPPFLEVGELERDFLEPDGEHFHSSCHFGEGKYPFLAPHRLTVSDTWIIAEWFTEEVPDSALVRRIALRWKDIRAWFAIGEATALMDEAGRAFFIVPILYDRVGPLYSLLQEHHSRIKASVVNATGGETELRQRVRDMVAHHAQMKLRQDLHKNRKE